MTLPIRCIQIGGPSGPIIQGPAEIGRDGCATITVKGRTYKGPLITDEPKEQARE